MKPVAVVLSGCGVFDGSEIHEAVLTLLALDRAGAAYHCLAPNQNQMHVINHAAKAAASETRNVLIESARIARGDVHDLAKVKAQDYRAVILPGGYGAVKNLCNYFEQKTHCKVEPHLEAFLKAMHQERKTIAAMCIAPVIVARVFGKDGSPRLTIGKDADTAAHLEAMGAKHVPCKVDEIVVDGDHRIITTPAYMLAHSIREAASGIDKLVHEVLKMSS